MTRLALLLSLLASVPALADYQGLPADGNRFGFVGYGARWIDTVRWRYNVANEPASLTRDQILTALQRAMAKWEAGCNIKFEYLGETNAPLMTQDGISTIGWSTDFGFDGYALFWWNAQRQINEGDIQFNYRGLTTVESLEANATHEIGHIIGLSHSDQPAAVMFSYPYHPYAYQNVLKGDDLAACARHYGGRGLQNVTDYSSLPVQPRAGLSTTFEIGTTVPAATPTGSSLSTIPADQSGTVYFAVHYNGLAAAQSLTLRLVSPDGTLYYSYPFSAETGNRYVYLSWTWPNTGMARLPGNWKLQLVDGDHVLAQHSFSVATGYATPQLPEVALLGQFQSGTWRFSHQMLTHGATLRNQRWTLDNANAGTDATLSNQLSSGKHSVQLWTVSTNPRYNGGIPSSSGQDADGPDGGHTLDFTLTDDGKPTARAFRSDVSGFKAAATVRSEIHIPETGTQQVYVAALLGNMLFFKSSQGWGLQQEPLLTVTGPAMISMPLLDRLDTRLLPAGTVVLGGYGSDIASLIRNGQFGELYKVQ
ncbi:matrixin family metalloprotease [Chitinimonas lacunae]|uniref:Matrixin family metalloprotease n=1 Tax=Chitinimonas lacunae TaxID=1963018 RepID=A0ABV8MNY4_9NEIS